MACPFQECCKAITKADYQRYEHHKGNDEKKCQVRKRNEGMNNIVNNVFLSQFLDCRWRDDNLVEIKYISSRGRLPPLPRIPPITFLSRWNLIPINFGKDHQVFRYGHASSEQFIQQKRMNSTPEVIFHFDQAPSCPLEPDPDRSVCSNPIIIPL